MIGQLHAKIACLQSHAVYLPAADWLITNRCFNPIDVSSNFGIAHYKNSHVTCLFLCYISTWHVPR